MADKINKDYQTYQDLSSVAIRLLNKTLPTGFAFELGIKHSKNMIFFLTKGKECYGYLFVKSKPYVSVYDPDRTVFKFKPRIRSLFNMRGRTTYSYVAYDSWALDKKKSVTEFLFSQSFPSFIKGAMKSSE